MSISPLTGLRPHQRISKWLLSDPVTVPYFDGLNLCFILAGLTHADEEEANSAIVAFLRLNPPDRLAASPYVFENYRKAAEAADEDDLNCRIESSQDVWRHVHPKEALVKRRKRGERAVYITIAAECDWDPEHGLQIVYRRGSELSRVSPQDGHLTYTDARNLPEDQDKIA